MFGDDHKNDTAADKSAEDLAAAVQAMTSNGTTDAPQNAFAPDPSATTDAPAPDAPTSDTPAVPADLMPSPAPAPDATTEQPSTADAVLAQPLPAPTKASPLSPADNDGLLDIKQNALEQLKPLVDHLDSVPEEKFDALMMMIRASDDQSLIQPAYEAAQKIIDDTKRAEALLDVVNEINYLTSNQQ